MKKYSVVIVCVTLFLIVSVPIVINGRERYGSNWIDDSKTPAILHYNDELYYEIGVNTFKEALEKGEYNFEYTDRYLTLNGRKAFLFDYYIPKSLNRKIGETKDQNGTIKYVYVLGVEDNASCFKLCEAEDQ